MPLLDHFRKPASRVPWRSIHSGWISELAVRLNAILPPGYIALDNMSIDGGLEVDIGIEEEDDPPRPTSSNTGGTAIATTRAVYAPPPATATVPYEFPDTTEIRVTNEETGQLVGAIELISPGNKDRGAKRDMFLAKCLDYIAGGAAVQQHFEIVRALVREREVGLAVVVEIAGRELAVIRAGRAAGAGQETRSRAERAVTIAEQHRDRLAGGAGGRAVIGDRKIENAVAVDVGDR